MSSKLIRGPGFGRPIKHRIELPYPKEEIAAVVTVILKRDNTVEVMGNVGNLEFGQLLLEAGKERLAQWHQEQAEKQAAKEQASGLVTPDGAPVEEASKLWTPGGPIKDEREHSARFFSCAVCASIHEVNDVELHEIKRSGEYVCSPDCALKRPSVDPEAETNGAQA